MNTIYQINEDLTLGKVCSVATGSPAPAGFTFTAPPKHDDDSILVWVGNGWKEVTAPAMKVSIQTEAQQKGIMRLVRQLHERIDGERSRRIVQGKPHSFPDGEGIVQLRDARDIINVNAVGTSAMMLVAAEDSDTLIDFRDQEDVTHQLTGSEALAMAQSVMVWVSDHYAAAWAHKDAIKALVEAQDYSGLSGYDISQGWPEES
jgi:hypothetical protein